MPHTSKVTILITVVLLLALKNLDAVEISPDFVNLNTYTNITIKGEWRSVRIEGAVVDFNITKKGEMYIGLKPLRSDGNVVIIVDNKTFHLPIENRCLININAANMTPYVYANVSQTGCGELRLYVNKTLYEPNAVYIPQYSGIYYLVATSGVFYEKTRVVVVPNVTIVDNVFGDIMRIKLTPPPIRGVVRIGNLRLPAVSSLEIDTWQLGGGNYTLSIDMFGFVYNYSLTIERAQPKLEVVHKRQYVYGDEIYINITVYVGNRVYKAYVELIINNTVFVQRAPFVFRIPLLDVSNYVVVANVLPDRNITTTRYESFFTITPAPVDLQIKINGTFNNPYVVNYGKVLNIDAVVRSLVTPIGHLQLLLNGRPHSFVVDTLKLGPGAWNLTVVFIPTSRNFQHAVVSTMLYIIPSIPTIVVNRTVTATYGKNLTVPIYIHLYGRPINATLYVDVVGKSGQYRYVANALRGVVNLDLGILPAGTYLATVSIAGSEGLLPTKEVFNIFVSSAPIILKLEVPPTGVYGQILPIGAFVEPGGVPGVLSIYINGSQMFSGNVSQYRGWWTPPRGGYYIVVARFQSLDPNYASTDNLTIVYIDRARCEISFNIVGDSADVDSIYVMRKYKIDIRPDFPATVYINSSRSAKSIVFNTTGVFNITVYFPGDDSYYPCGSTKFIKVVKNPIDVEILPLRRIASTERGVPVEIILKGSVGREDGIVIIYKNNITYNETEIEKVYISKSISTILNFNKPGVYNVYIEYLGNDYYQSNRSNAVVITVEPSVFGTPIFLLLLYGGALAIGFVTAFLTKKILK
ncbi:MAG: hypothetical protein QXK67_00355 [Pyrobaculum sp.]